MSIPQSTLEPCMEIAQLLVDAGRISDSDLKYAIRVREKLSEKKPLLTLLKELELVSEEEVQSTLQENRLNIRIGSLIFELGLITTQEMQTALGIQRESDGKKLGEILVENHFISEHELLEVLSVQLGFEYWQDQLPMDKRLTAKIRPQWFEKNECFPVRSASGALLLAIHDPDNLSVLQEAEKFFGQTVQPCLAQRAVIKAAIRMLLEQRGTKSVSVNSESEIVRIVNQILQDSIARNASDIHIEPMKDKVRIRCREDGVLIQHMELPLELAPALTSRIKIMAGADIAERRRHQDGRMNYEFEGMKLDLRVSFYSTIHGEKIVMRLLNNRSNLLDINDIGMAPRMVERFRNDVLDVPSGVVLVTGPTGSGKTTSLYASINYLNNINTSIITAEDPVEYVIPGISQCSINSKINITYEETLRHIVRQDPDVIVIGEIRDRFSADTAIQAALTGHKVLTTFHTEDSIGGLLRLLHMDIEAFLISSTVVSVVAQRLVRRVCPTCAEDHKLTPDEIRRLGYKPEDAQSLTFARGKGCTDCRHLGYKGRVGIFELLILDEAVKEALIQRRTSYDIRRISIESSGLVSLLEDGIIKATQGQTSFEEIMRSLPRLTKPRPIQELHRLQGVRK